jgi:hypothetical protein
MTLFELRAAHPAYRVTGHGLFAIVCSSAGRITLVETLEVARGLKHMACGHGCDRYTNPHEGIVLAQSAPVKTKFRMKTYRD